MKTPSLVSCAVSQAFFLLALGSGPGWAADDSDTPTIDASPTTEATEIKDQKRLNYIIHDFQLELVRLGSNSTVVSCDKAFEYRVNFHTGRAGESYAASCTISNQGKLLDFMICNDYMIGKFTLGGSDAHTQNGLTRFMKNNCPPGG